MKDTGHEPGARVDQALDQLPRGIEPARDLWPAIEARLEPRGARRSLHWPGLAAAGLLLAVGSSLLTAGLMRREFAASAPPAPQASTVRAAPTAVTLSRAAFGPGQALGPGYDAIRSELADSLDARVAGLSAADRARLETSLLELRRATADINAALQLRPGDPLLEELLINAYQDELAVFANVSLLTETAGVATMNDASTSRIPL